MYRYSVSFKDELCALPEWGRAAAASGIKRIEFSCIQSTPVETLIRAVSGPEGMRNAGIVEFSGIHISFGGERRNIDFPGNIGISFGVNHLCGQGEA